MPFLPQSGIRLAILLDVGRAKLPDGRWLFGEDDFDQDRWALSIEQPEPREAVDRWINSAARRLLDIEGTSPRWLLDALDKLAVVAMPLGDRFRCRCCGNLTLSARDYYEICPVCRWEDDPTTIFFPGERRGGPGPNHVSLSEARTNYRTNGVSEPAAGGHPREPYPAERPNA
jgi:hypothetical protein